MLNKIRLFCLDNPDKIIIATGDTKQLSPIEDITNCQDKEVYANQCLDTIFKHNIFVEISKRVKREKNRKIVNDMYANFWVNKLPLEELIQKYFETTDDVMTSDYNIAYTNNRCLGASKKVRRRLGKTGDDEITEVLVCRLYKKMRERIRIKTKKGKLCSNFTAQRIDNTLPHTVDNCIAWCLYWNCSAH